MKYSHKSKCFFKRRNISILLLPILLFLSIISCEDNDKEDTLKRYHISMDLSKSLSFTDFIGKVEVLTFEGTDSSLMKNITRIRCSFDYIYLSDNSQQIFIFSKDGKFINKINSRGTGPQEYLNLGSFEIDKFGKRICVLDPMRSNLISYSLKGEFLKIEKLPSLSEGAYGEFCFIENNRILFTSGNTSARVTIYNAEKGIIEREFMPHTLEFTNSSMCKIFNETYLSEEYSDVIYQYANGEVKPSYRIKVDNLSCNLIGNIGNYDFPENIRKLIDSELSDYYINSVNGNSDILYISLSRKGNFYSYLIDKDSNKFFCFNVVEKELQPNIKYIDNEMMIGLYIEESKEQYLKAFSEYGLSLPSEDKLNEMNPILIKYHLKKKI